MSEADEKEIDYSHLRGESKLRKRRKKKWRDVLVVVTIILIVIAVTAFIFSPYCAVGTVQLSGNKSVSLDDICREGQIRNPVNIIRLQPAVIEGLLKKDLRIASVEVERKWWPPTLSIKITENAVMAYIFSNYGTLSLDKKGMVVAAQKTFSNYDAPLITGVRLSDEYVGDYARNKEVVAATEFLARLESTTFDLISEVKLQNSQEVYLLLTDGLQVRLGDFSRADVKSKYIKQMIKEIAEKNFAISLIDLKFEPPTMRVKQ
ncbi:MAG: FtsQ-type POTRA domain-containing protein [Negativicutes bacterium]|jgi:cell division protein FtsQ